MSKAISYRERIYTPRMKWALRIVFWFYLIGTPITWELHGTLENACNVAMVFCLGVLWVDLDLRLLGMRWLNARYDISIRRKIPNHPLKSVEFSRSRNILYRRHLYKYPIGNYVYVLKDVSVSGNYKIGRTNNPARRITRFDVVLPIEVHIVFVIPCQNEVALESHLHKQFKSKRIRGEWFNLAPEDIQFLIDAYSWDDPVL